MAKDPVCGMEVDPKEAAARSEYRGQTHYFCAPGCKKKFDENPKKYAGHTATAHKRRKRGRWRLRLSPWLIVMPVMATGVVILAVLILTSGSAGTTGPAQESTPDQRVAEQAPTASFTIEAGDEGADGRSFFRPDTIRARAGDVIELVVTNTGSVSHNLRVSGPDGEYGTSDDFEPQPFAIKPDETVRTVVKIESPGTYPFRCDFHPALQVGTLVLS